MYVFNENDCYSAIYNALTNIKYKTDKKSKNNYIVCGSGFDIETTSIIECKTPITAYCYQWQFSINEYVVMGRDLQTMKLFFSCLIDFCENLYKENARFLVWVANLGFEFQFCKKVWFELGLSEFFCKEPRNPLKVTVGNCIEFRECIGLFGHSLKDIANNYSNVKKLIGDLDYKKIRNSYTPLTKDEINYCINDVLILSDLGNYVFNNFFGRLQSVPLTSTGFIRNKIKKKAGKNLKAIREKVVSELPEENEYYLFRNLLYKGGLCGTNSEYMDEIIKGVCCADLTSDYPATMEHNKFPDGKPEVCENNEFCQYPYIPYIAILQFDNIESTTTHSVISYHKCMNRKELDAENSIIDNGRIYKADRIVVLLNDIEMKTFQKAYTWSDMKVLKCWKFPQYKKIPRYILDVLEEQYKIKNELKKQGKTNTQEYKDSKSFVNGIYGMTATSIFPDEKILDGTSEVNVIVKENAKTYEKITEKMFLSPFIAFWVTSYARNILIDIIVKYPDSIVQYDTDSIYFRTDMEQTKDLYNYLYEYNENIEKLNRALFNNDENFLTLGQWDIEKPLQRFKGLGSKRYMKETKRNFIRMPKKYNYKINHELCETVDFTKMFHVKQVIAGCRNGTVEKQYKQQNNIKDIFKFFSDRMYIDILNSNKLESHYIDESITLDITDVNGKTQTCYCPSALVLCETDFTIKLKPEHIDFYKSVKARKENDKL